MNKKIGGSIQGMKRDRMSQVRMDRKSRVSSYLGKKAAQGVLIHLGSSVPWFQDLNINLVDSPNINPIPSKKWHHRNNMGLIF
ncbi:hypothetical protein TNCV_678891 [Trichonephila clavipes]|nr:hypothetical protein TNCV_678891 [Trichonephila clavipes]